MGHAFRAMRRYAVKRPAAGFLRRAAGALIESTPRTLAEAMPEYVIGRGTYGKPVVHNYLDGATLRIGAFCSLADVTIFLGGEHRIDWVTTYPFSVLWPEAQHIPGHPASKGDVVIGNDVWIASGATILSGTTIGDGAVVGAQAVVSGHVEPYAIVAGNPARMVRKRFDDDTIRRLVETAWWTWPDDDIRAALPLLLDGDIAAFLAHAERAHAVGAPGRR
jgi:acetyltransferase-like isoleucine patch superfamily enzyme